MTKIAIIKNGSGIEQYQRLNTEWKDNSIELIWDINELRKRYNIVLISLTEDSNKKKLIETRIALYDIPFTHQNYVKKVWVLVKYAFDTLRIIYNEKIDYLVISNFRFITLFLLFSEILKYNVILNFSRDNQVTQINLFLLKAFRIRHIIAPGLMANKLSAMTNANVHMRLPRYPRSFFSESSTPEIPYNQFIVGFIGRLIKSKGIYEFIRAAELLSCANACYTFIVIGDGPELPKVKRLVEECQLTGRVKILGYKTNVEIGTYLRKFHVLVSPTYTEGFSKTWIEAIYTETPMILTKISDIDKLIEDGVHGLYIEKESYHDIVEKITLLHEDTFLYNQIKQNLKQLKEEELFSNSMTFEEIICGIIDSDQA